jgi:acetyl-CoA carboxylase carboxyl transferase subunit alpha
MALQTLDFEKPIVEIEEQIEALRAEAADDPQSQKRLPLLEKELADRRQTIYSHLTPWNRVQIARHFARPRALDFIRGLLTDWTEIKGDRYFADDKAAVCGLGRLDGQPVAVVAQQKGRDTKENVLRNFGMMHPEGYRKALRVMRLAERFRLPIVVLIDTPGAYPGIGAEERGQSEAIARNIMEMFTIETPIVGIIIGEGASGGALGIGVVDKMMMFENSWYCVISPEGCASILLRDASKAPDMATTLKLTAEDLQGFGIADEVVPEPMGGAHHDPARAIENLRAPLRAQIARLAALPITELLENRFEKYRKMGVIASE